MLRWVFPDAGEYLRNFPRLVSAFAGAAFSHETAHRAEGFAGAAIWLPPGVGPDEEATGALFEEVIPDERKEKMYGFLGQMAAFHPEHAHSYLPLIGVDPSQQGRGHGSSLLKYANTICDKDRKVAYLEATSPDNKRLYERHGFEEVGVIQTASSPPMWRWSASRGNRDVIPSAARPGRAHVLFRRGRTTYPAATIGHNKEAQR